MRLTSLNMMGRQVRTEWCSPLFPRQFSSALFLIFPVYPLTHLDPFDGGGNNYENRAHNAGYSPSNSASSHAWPTGFEGKGTPDLGRILPVLSLYTEAGM